MHDDRRLYPILPGKDAPKKEELDRYAPEGSRYRAAWEYVLTHDLTEGERSAFWHAVGIMDRAPIVDNEKVKSERLENLPRCKTCGALEENHAPGGSRFGCTFELEDNADLSLWPVEKHSNGEMPLPSPLVIHDLLSLVEVKVPVSEIIHWSDAQKVAATSWASAVHLVASDNEGIEIPPKPEFLNPRGFLTVDDFKQHDRVVYMSHPDARPEYGTVVRTSSRYVFVKFDGNHQPAGCIPETLRHLGEGEG